MSKRKPTEPKAAIAKPAPAKNAAPPKTKRKRPKGVRSHNPANSAVYSDRIADEILRRLETGEPLKQICRTPGMPAMSTVLSWSRELRHEFAAKFAIARENGWAAIADEILEIADDSSRDLVERADGSFAPDYENVQRARLKIDSRKWLLSKMLPRTYGDRYHASVSGEDGAPLTFKFIADDEDLL